MLIKAKILGALVICIGAVTVGNVYLDKTKYDGKTASARKVLGPDGFMGTASLKILDGLQKNTNDELSNPSTVIVDRYKIPADIKRPPAANKIGTWYPLKSKNPFEI